MFFVLVFLTNCSQKENVYLDFTITKVFLDINNYDHAGLPPIVKFEILITNKTDKDIVLRSSDKYSENIDSKMILFNLTSNKAVVIGGYSTTKLLKNETKTIESFVDLRGDIEEKYFGISKDFFEERGFDFSKDIDFLLSKIRETFEHSIAVAYLNSESLNHLNPINQANKFLKEDQVIQIKWSENVQYELYKEQPPLPVVEDDVDM